MKEHIVQRGECISSIADSHRVSWKRLWDLPENGDLKRLRKNPNLLFPGDIVAIPDREIREEAKPTNQRHRFQLTRQRVLLRLRLLAAGKPIAGERYILELGGTKIKGSTDGDGLLKEFIPATLADALLRLPKSKLNLRLLLGHLDPIEEISGVQARLNNLGYHCGDEDGTTRSAIQAFQETKKLKVTGDPDQATKDKLRESYGC